MRSLFCDIILATGKPGKNTLYFGFSVCSLTSSSMSSSLSYSGRPRNNVHNTFEQELSAFKMVKKEYKVYSYTGCWPQRPGLMQLSLLVKMIFKNDK